MQNNFDDLVLKKLSRMKGINIFEITYNRVIIRLSLEQYMGIQLNIKNHWSLECY